MIVDRNRWGIDIVVFLIFQNGQKQYDTVMYGRLLPQGRQRFADDFPHEVHTSNSLNTLRTNSNNLADLKSKNIAWLCF